MLAPASLEDRRLLNPAFSGLVVLRSSITYYKETTKGLPFIYAFLVLPLVLHAETRERIPHSIATALTTWTERNSDLVAGFGRHAKELGPATREGLIYLAASKVVNFDEDGALNPLLQDRVIKRQMAEIDPSEAAECINRAAFIGRWLSSAGTIPTVLTALGVRP